MISMSDPKELGDLIHRELVRLGIWREAAEARANLEPEKTGMGYGYPIIGLEKFLGYFDRSLNIANFPSGIEILNLRNPEHSGNVHQPYMRKSWNILENTLLQGWMF